MFQLDVFDAADRYQQSRIPLIVLAGKEYGSGSSRDWAAKGPFLLVNSNCFVWGVLLTSLFAGLRCLLLFAGHQGRSSRELRAHPPE